MDTVIAALIAQVRTAGLTLSAEGGRLAVRGPRSAEPLLAALREHKAEVLAWLAADGQGSIRLPVPAQSAPDSVPDKRHSPLVVRLTELMAAGLDEATALGRALAELGARHAQQCDKDPWLPDDAGILRCFLCGRTAPPEVQERVRVAKEAGVS